MNDKRIDAGNDSQNTIGNNNNNNNTITNINQNGPVFNFDKIDPTMLIPGTRVITESEIYKICCIIADSPLTQNPTVDVTTNANWLKKIHFNQLKKYSEIFEMYMPYYDVVESVLSSSDINGESVLRNIKSIYIDLKYSETVLSPDTIIDYVYSQLDIIVRESVSQITLTVESIKDSLHLIIFYAFTFCQILEIPPRDYELNF